MGFISRAIEQRAHPANAPDWLAELFGGWHTATGKHVDEEKSLAFSAVFACVRIVSEDIGSLPLPVYEKLRPRGKRRDPSHPLFEVLHDQPNPEVTSMEFRETVQMHLMLWGNGYVEIVRDRAGRVSQLWPITPKRVKVTRPKRRGPLAYEIRLPGGGRAVLPAERMLHIRALSLNGVTGISPIGKAREAVGLGLAAEEFGARFFGNDARPGVVLKHPKTLSDTAHKNLRQSWEADHKGLKMKHRLGILEEGMDLSEVGIPPEDAQFLATRRFQVADVARFYRMPLHKLNDLERAIQSNIEQQAIDYVRDAVRPWTVRWEQGLRGLFTPRERERWTAKFVIDGLLRGDVGARFEAYSKGRQWSIYSINDVRELEDLNPVPGGDDYHVPLNMVPVDQAGSDRALRAVPELEPDDSPAAALVLEERREQIERRSAEERRRTAVSWRGTFADAIARVVRAEEQRILPEARRLLEGDNVQAFVDFLGRFYSEHHAFVADRLRAPMGGLAEAVAGIAAEEVEGTRQADDLESFVAAYVTSFADRSVGMSKNQLMSVALDARDAGEDPLAAVEGEVSDWRENRPDRTARMETVQLGAATAKHTYSSAGVQRIRWRAFGKSCPYCMNLDGTVVGIRQPFLSAGESFQPEGADAPLSPSVDVGHAPAHSGCDCTVSPG